MSGPEREPLNVEGAPTLVYELWIWEYRDSDGRVLWPEEQYWRFLGYRVLSLRQVLRYKDFGYHVERSLDRDHRSLVPLFPRLDSTEKDQGNGLDSLPVSES